MESIMEKSRDIAELFDVTQPAVSKWVQRGCPHEDRGSKKRPQHFFDPVDVDNWLRDKCLGPYNKSGRSSAGNREATDEEPKALRDKKDYWLAKKYEIQVKKERGELIPLEEVRQERLQRIEAVRAGLFSLPARLSGVCAGRSETEIQDEIESAINDLLERFAADG
jgi:phage terminase Nu1 subunit (DNA packaging protein)